MRIGVLGAGRIGQAHIANLATTAGVDEVLVHDPDIAAVDAVAAHARACATADELVDRSDGVIVATPTADHPDGIRRVAEAGLPCFCEKPISLDLASTEATLAHVEVARTELQVGFQRRFDPGFRELKRLVDSGELGDLYLIRAASHDHEPPHEGYLAKSGSIFRDMLIHDFDALAWLSGRRPIDVYASGSVLVDEMFARHGDIDTTAAVVRLEGGAMAVLTGTRQNGVGYDHRTEIIGSRDSASAGLGPHTPMRSADPGGPQPRDPYPTFPARFHDAYAAEMEAFARLVGGKGENRCPGSAAADALRLAIAADISLAEERPVCIDEVNSEAGRHP
jgi:myo-inositol 2-dehydrogenase/D-chiro-inositol 1-dehydrogenase